MTFSTSSFKPPVALILCAACVVAIELAARLALGAWWTPLCGISDALEDDAFRFRARLETVEPGRPRLLLMGSSQVREGADAPAVERFLAEAGFSGAQVVNLGTSAGAFLELDQQLDLALRVRPDLILASPGPHGLYWPNAGLRHLPDYTYSLRSAGLLAWQLRDATDGERLQEYLGLATLYSILPSTRQVRSYHTPSLARRLVRGQAPAHPDYSDDRNLSLDEMAALGAAYPRPVFSPLSEAQPAVADRLVVKVRAAGIPIVFVDYPMNPAGKSLTADWEPSLRETQAILFGLSDRHGVRYIPRDELPAFGPEDFRDVSHLNDVGRARMSRFLADIAMEALGRTD